MHRVLVVEDEPLIRLTVIDALKEAGFYVVEASSADEAVRIVDGQDIHFLFTDIQMPGRLSGVDLAHAVAERFPNAGIFVASGRIRPEDIDLPSGSQFFSKPYSFANVIIRLKA
ncbi:response regulator [Neorhizobium sp. DAR64872/K0K18]|uniref:response regulator n=1 Tax=Neorhizobium sp. DAR64872/K0K18 TaxID=3421958 RepID=UPI003D27327C